MSYPDPSLITRIRQNHAVEHATMHVLIHANPLLRLVGRSDWRGFWFYGNVDTQVLTEAALEGLTRLKHGEDWLAIHPRCGTNLAVSTLLAGGAAYAVAAFPARSWLKRMAGIALAMAAGLAVARPLGLTVQRQVTTSPDVQDVQIEAVRREQRGNLIIHQVVLTRSA